MKQLWVEKYRPKTLDGYVFTNTDEKAIIEHWIKEGTIPHLLIYGPAGTGKTTLAKILINALEIEDYDVMYANGSKEARKVEWIDKLISFSQTMSFGAFKIVLVDEADYMNINSVQPALRNLMEDYTDNVRFILTCNYPNKIMPAIHSRCHAIHINKTDHTEFTARAATVLVSEGIAFDLDTLDSYVKATYPDLRKCLNLLQGNSTTGTLVKSTSKEAGIKDWRLDAVDLFKTGRIKDARTLICSQATADDLEGMWRWMYDNLDLWSETDDGKDEAIQIIRDGIVYSNQVADQEINVSATLSQLCNIGK